MTKYDKGSYIPIQMHVEFLKTHVSAKLPTQAHEGEDIGFDLYAVYDHKLEPRETVKIPIGLRFATTPAPPEVSHLLTPFFKIEGRSGLASKGVFPVGGIVDLGYRGELNVVLHNGSNQSFQIDKGDKVAQLVCYLTFTNANGITMDMKFTDKIEESNRGTEGFGSTGK